MNAHCLLFSEAWYCSDFSYWAAKRGGLTRSVLVFIPVWLIVAAGNLWIGVNRAGYSVAEEAPIFLLIVAVPTLLALLWWWKLPR